MIRKLLTLALGIGSGLAIMPLLAVAQGSGGGGAGEQSEEWRKWRGYLEEDWKQWMREYPDTTTDLGFPGQNRRWTDDSPDGIAERVKHLHSSLATLKAFQKQELAPSEQLNFDLYRELLETGAAGVYV